MFGIINSFCWLVFFLFPWDEARNVLETFVSLSSLWVSDGDFWGMGFLLFECLFIHNCASGSNFLVILSCFVIMLFCLYSMASVYYA